MAVGETDTYKITYSPLLAVGGGLYVYCPLTAHITNLSWFQQFFPESPITH